MGALLGFQKIQNYFKFLNKTWKFIKR
jgi:hypothetical protein